jgi:flagellar basal-body rod protein FlgG
MVKMIQGMRGYETAQKLIQTLDRMTETAIQDIGRVA